MSTFKCILFLRIFKVALVNCPTINIGWWLWVFQGPLQCTNLSGQERAPGWVNLPPVPWG